MAVIDVNEVPSNQADNQPDNQPDQTPQLITYDDGYSLKIAGVESEVVPYGQPIEMTDSGVPGVISPCKHYWLAWCDLDLDPETDEIFTTLENYAYCDGRGVEIEIVDAVEDAEDDGDDEDILVEADPHHPLAEKLINQQGESKSDE